MKQYVEEINSLIEPILSTISETTVYGTSYRWLSGQLLFYRTTTIYGTLGMELLQKCQIKLYDINVPLTTVLHIVFCRGT